MDISNYYPALPWDHLGPAWAWLIHLACLPILNPPPPLPLYAQDNKRIMGACLYRAHVSSFLLLHFLLVIFIISLFFIEIFCLTCTPRHLALHRSWLHVLVLFGRSVFFLSALCIDATQP